MPNNDQELNVHPHKYDTIIIGSGVAAMTCAISLLRNTKQKILIVEKLKKFGGMTHQFMRLKKYDFNSGLHYVGQYKKGQITKRLFDWLTRGQLKWHPLPEQFEIFHFPHFDFAVSSHVQKYKQDLISKFPQEKRAIKRYFRDIRWASFLFVVHQVLRSAVVHQNKIIHVLYKILLPFMQLGLKSTKEYLDSYFHSQDIKAILAAQWGDYGVPPEESLFGAHALVVSHYFSGAAYPIGGSRKIAEFVQEEFKETNLKHPGRIDVMTGVTVEQLLFNDNVGDVSRCQQTEGDYGTQQCYQVVGVRIEQGGPKATTLGLEQHDDTRNKNNINIYSNHVISTAGIFNTYSRMLPENKKTILLEDLKSLKPSYSACILFLGFDQQPLQDLGFQGENHWIFPGVDHSQMASVSIPPGEGILYLSMSSLNKSGGVAPAESAAFSAEVIVLCDFQYFKRWENMEAVQRKADPDYIQKKKEISEKILDRLEKQFPGFRSRVAFSELSTPLTFGKYQNAVHGAFYGVMSNKEKFNSRLINSKSVIFEGLYLAGQDTFLPGILPAALSGLRVSRKRKR